MRAIFRKEMADYFTSIRCFILFLLALLVSAAALYSASLGIRETTVTATGPVFLKLFTTEASELPSLFAFISLIALFFVPIVGIALGFDAINGEHSGGTLSRIISQPVYRDSVINAKFIAGMATLSLLVVTTVMLVSGYGLRLIGVPPSSEELFRLFIFVVFAVVLGAFWMSLSILFSVLFRKIATSLLSSAVIWLFLGFFYIIMIAPAIANAVAPTDGTDAALIHNIELQLTLARFSPNYLFLEASMALLQPPSYGSLLLVGTSMSGNPLSLGQSLLLVWPHFTLLVSITLICFAISYVAFMRQEVRTT
jgi:ABC-2 type transport system permease protein